MILLNGCGTSCGPGASMIEMRNYMEYFETDVSHEGLMVKQHRSCHIKYYICQSLILQVTIKILE